VIKLPRGLRRVKTERYCSIMEQEEGRDDARPNRASNEIGPVGQRVAQNIKGLREARGLNQTELAEAVKRLGRPVTRTAVSKTEEAKRRIDVDDLIAFALALRATPNRLLLPKTADAEKPYDVTPDYRVSELDAWRWALGEHPLDRGFDAPPLQMVVEDDRERWFRRENRPDRAPDQLFNPVERNPELMAALREVAREVHRLGIAADFVQYAFLYAYLTETREARTGGEG
jgi:transcriptional regulator with XRE-family HTH domain